MYLRYLASYRNSVSGRDETGIFRSADFVRDHSGIGEEEKAALQALITWFDENLPVPGFYDFNNWLITKEIPEGIKKLFETAELFNK